MEHSERSESTFILLPAEIRLFTILLVKDYNKNHTMESRSKFAISNRTHPLKCQRGNA